MTRHRRRGPDVEGIDPTTPWCRHDQANDLSGTDVVEVNTNLAAFGGAGDAAVDNVIVQGTNAMPSSWPAMVRRPAAGLAAQVNITGAEPPTASRPTRSPATTWWRPRPWRPARSSSPPTVGRQRRARQRDGERRPARRPLTDVLLGGLGVDVIDGGDDDIEIQFARTPSARRPGPTTMARGARPDRRWPDQLDVGGRSRTART